MVPPEPGGSVTRDGPIKKRVGRQQRREERFHAAAIVLVGAVGVLKHRRVVDRFVAAHPETKDMTDKDLLSPLALGQLLDHLHHVFHK